MRRLPKTHKKLPMKKQDEPDFYKLDKSSPLPELDESQGSNSLNANVMALRRQQGAAGIHGGLHGGIPGSMTSALPQGFPGMSHPQQMGQLGQHPAAGAMQQGAGAYGFNKPGKDPLSSIGAMNGMGGLGGYSDPLRSQNIGGLPGAPAPGGLGGRPGGELMGAGAPPAGGDSQLFQLQRLRHLQHLQLFQRQIGAASMAGAEDLARIQAEHALGLR
jgi:hypothetical protein